MVTGIHTSSGSSQRVVDSSRPDGALLENNLRLTPEQHLAYKPVHATRPDLRVLDIWKRLDPLRAGVTTAALGEATKPRGKIVQVPIRKIPLTPASLAPRSSV